MSVSSSPSATAQTPTTKPPVVVIQDDSFQDDSFETSDNGIHRKKRAKTKGNDSSSKPINQQPPPIFHPESNRLLDAMLHPLLKRDFLHDHFRKDAVHIQRHHQPDSCSSESNVLVSDICKNYLFDLDARQIFAETSSENVFLWLRRPPPSEDSPTDTCSKNSVPQQQQPATLNSVEISDPETAYALHKSGSHPAYCRAPPILEHHLVGSLLRATGLGGGHYHPPHVETVTLGGGTTLGRGEVELFIGASSASSSQGYNGAKRSRSGNTNNGTTPAEKKKKHTTGWHTDFQENFTIQLSGIKRWTLRRGRVRHPLRGTTPHYARDSSVVENQLKVARLSCLAGNGTTSGVEFDSSYGFEYGEHNAYGPEQTVTLYPGDVLYFPSGMWHCVETLEPGISLNVSLMGTTYATLVCEALQHLLVGSNEGWREIVTSRPGDEDGAERLEGLLGGLSNLVDNFVTKQGGAQSLLPPALCHPPLGNDDDDDEEEEEDGSFENDASGDENDKACDSKEGDDQSSSDGLMDEQIEDGSDNGDEDDTPSSGIIIPMDDFEGPPGWTCSRPSNAKLVRNPLASLIAMSDIAGHHQQEHQNSSGANASNNGDEQKETTKQYVLNVNFAGNEMMESHIRVILETSNPKLVDLMDWYLKCEARMQDPGGQVMNDQSDNPAAGTTPPLCLFYYGYFSWSN
ncbi:hypothetical protein ACHAXR_009713 [Thalassiosira sp. AJA248-18]